MHVCFGQKRVLLQQQARGGQFLLAGRDSQSPLLTGELYGGNTQETETTELLGAVFLRCESLWT